MRKYIFIVAMVIMMLGMFACNSNDTSVVGEIAEESNNDVDNIHVINEIYTDEELAQIKELLGEEVYEEYFVTTTENGEIENYGCVLHQNCIGLYYRVYVPETAGKEYYNMIICEHGNIYGEIGPGPEGTFFTNDPETAEMPNYRLVEKYMTYREFKDYLGETAPNMQAGDIIELPTNLDYFFALGEDVWEYISGTDILKIRIESSYILKHPSGKIFLMLSYADQYYTHYPDHYYIDDPVLAETYWLHIYDITDDKMGRTDIWYDIQIVGEVGIDRIEAVRTLNMLGTYQSYKDYRIDENGNLIALSEDFDFELHESGNGKLKVKKDLPVMIDGEECFVKPGEEIVITGCGSGHKGEIYFQVVSTGEEGTIFYKKTYIGWIEIDGIDQYEYFENLLELYD